MIRKRGYLNNNKIHKKKTIFVLENAELKMKFRKKL